MSDTNECCVCYEATEHLTPCNHLVCESCYPRLNTCPMCRAPLENGVPPMGFSFDEINWGMAEAAFLGYLDIVRLMLFRGANNYNTGLTSAASGGHLDIVLLMLELGANNFNEAMARVVVKWGFQDKLHSMTPPKTLIWETSALIDPSSEQLKEISRVVLNDPAPRNSLKQSLIPSSPKKN